MSIFSGCSGGGGGSSSGNSGLGDGEKTSEGVNSALLGALVNADVKVYALYDLQNPIELTRTGKATEDVNTSGRFNLQLKNFDDDSWIVVSISGGEDIDADDDGIIDTNPTPNQGTIRAIAKVSDAKKGLSVNILSEVVYQQLQNRLDVNSSTLQQNLQLLTDTLVKEDINSDGKIDYDDILAFKPYLNTHKKKLTFDYDVLFIENEDNDSLMKVVHSGNTGSFQTFSKVIFEDTVSILKEDTLKKIMSNLLVPSNADNITQTNLHITSFVSEKGEVLENSEASVLIAEDEHNRTILLGYVLKNADVTQNSSSSSLSRSIHRVVQNNFTVNSNVEVSTRSTALALVMTSMAFTIDKSEKSKYVAKVLAHKKFETLIALVNDTFESDPYFLDHLMGYTEVTTLIREIRDDILDTNNTNTQSSKFG